MRIALTVVIAVSFLTMAMVLHHEGAKDTLVMGCGFLAVANAFLFSP